MPMLTDAFDELVNIHQRFLAAANLDVEEQILQGFQQLHNTCVEAINRVRQVRVGRQGWNLSNSGHEPNRSNPHENQAETHKNTVQPHYSSSFNQQHEP
jgi:hypothetical protein